MTKELAKITIKAELGDSKREPVEQLREACEEFLENNTALREINTQIDEMPEREYTPPPNVTKALTSLTKDQKIEVEGFVDLLLDILKDVGKAIDKGDISERFVKDITTKDRAVVDTVVHLMRNMTSIRRPARWSIVRKSLLSVCISEYELLVGATARFALRSRPESLEASEATLTLTQLKSFESIEDGIEYVIERRVDELLRANSKEWTKWFDRFSIPYSATVPDPTGYAEMNARRNVLVHNGGRVNEQYLRVVDGAQLSVADELTVDDQYLDECLQRTSAMGLLLVFSAISKLDRAKIEGHTKWAMSEIKKLLHDRQFQATYQCSQVILEKTRGKLLRRDELDIQIDAWTALRALGRVEEVRESVERWDVSGLTPYYKLCRAALLGNNEEAKDLLDEEIEQGRISLVGAAINPLFTDLLSAEEEHEALLLVDAEQKTTVPHAEDALNASPVSLESNDHGD